MKIYQSRSFAKKIKRFTKSEKSILDGEIKEIIKNPIIGTEKKGDLKGVFIYKIKIKSLQYLLAYRFNENKLELIMISPHENYYRNLKKYIR